MVYGAWGYRRARSTVQFGLSCPEIRSALQDPSEDRAVCYKDALRNLLEHSEQLTVPETSRREGMGGMGEIRIREGLRGTEEARFRSKACEQKEAGPNQWFCDIYRYGKEISWNTQKDSWVCLGVLDVFVHMFILRKFRKHRKALESKNLIIFIIFVLFFFSPIRVFF